MNVLSQFLQNATGWGDRTAIVAPSGETISFGALAVRSDRLAGLWRRQGIAPGDRVLVALPLGLSLYIAIAALWRLGATIVFPEPALGVRGLRHSAATTRPKAFLAAGWHRALVLLPEVGRIPIRLSLDAIGGDAKDIVHNSGDDHPALISFTSGSTGTPKAIVRSHGFLAAQNACLADLLRPKREGQTDLVVFPVFVIANLGLGVGSALPNWKLTRHDRADPAAIARLIAACGVSRMLAPPAICEIIAGGPPMPSLRTVLTGGGPVFPDVLERLAKRLATDDIVAVYGSTEAEPIAVQPLKDISAADWKTMSEGGGLLAGRPISQAHVEIVEDEIQVAGDHVNKGYLDPARDAETKVRRDGAIWHRTGDAGRLDSAGRLWLLGRLGARAGRWRAFMVEAAARRWTGVRQAALIPGSDPPTLALAGDARHLTQWTQHAAPFPGLRLLPVDSIPVDRRHRSKVDYPALARETSRSANGDSGGRQLIAQSIGVGALRLAFAARRKKLNPAKTGLPVETIAIASTSGARIAGWFLPGETGHGAVLLLHGVTDNRMDVVERMRFLNREGFATLAIDFQAHGMSEGRYITLGARESFDARAALAWLRARLPDEKIGVIAISLGGAAALVGDTPLAVDALALESVYPDIVRATRNRFRFFVGPLGDPLSRAALACGEIALGVDRQRLRPIDGIERVSAPVFILSGARDPWTPIEETRELFARATAPKTLWEVPAAGHVDLCDFAPNEYRRRMISFLTEALAR